MPVTSAPNPKSVREALPLSLREWAPSRTLASDTSFSSESWCRVPLESSISGFDAPHAAAHLVGPGQPFGVAVAEDGDEAAGVARADFHLGRLVHPLVGREVGAVCLADVPDREFIPLVSAVGGRGCAVLIV